MSDTDTIGLDQTEEEMLAYVVSDETLETAAGTGEQTSGEPYTCLHLFLYMPNLSCRF
jgi:hypothetical protein